MQIWNYLNYPVWISWHSHFSAYDFPRLIFCLFCPQIQGSHCSPNLMIARSRKKKSSYTELFKLLGVSTPNSLLWSLDFFFMFFSLLSGKISQPANCNIQRKSHLCGKKKPQIIFLFLCFIQSLLERKFPCKSSSHGRRREALVCQETTSL